ncbi:EF-hand calcium-binding domain-containing protein 12 [Antechinus flavipes]|uniref:EF-hand calcium-binding domain-containing protein 12 n=1 Tax=Antechinus flavipes TaxID=38775 RepID=UPI00223584D8|nr:EF-hand calcium-binding domain-containing protein 12 [Antechinus flavipes]
MCRRPQKQTEMNSTWFKYFKATKKPDFKMPTCRHRIFISPPSPEIPCSPITSKSKVLVEAAAPCLQVDSSTKSYTTVEISQEEKQIEDEDEVHKWLIERLKTKKELDTFVNLEKWIYNKPRTTKLENRVLRRIYTEQEEEQAAQRAAKIVSVEDMIAFGRPCKGIPTVIIPAPSCLSVLYEHLLTHRIRVFEMFCKGVCDQQISREEFVKVMKRIGAPLTDREFEDVMIYLSSLNKNNKIYREDLTTSYRQWLSTKKSDTYQRANLSYWRTVKRIKTKKGLPSPSSSSKFLEVPPINTEPDRMRLSYEDMEVSGKRFRELRRQSKRKLNPLLFLERYRLVRTGIKPVDDHCLPSTLPDEFGELTNAFRQATFLVYLKCLKACEDYQIPLTEKTLMKALLYHGDKIVLERDHVLKLRQPGGYYDEIKEHTPTLTKYHVINESTIKKKPQKPVKRMKFGEFEALSRKIMRRCHKPFDGRYRTHPNFFWPGHLLDKLLLYLPDKKWEKQMVLFSRVDKKSPVYPARYHPRDCWPVSDAGYVTSGEFDRYKQYF